jgi:hypothetical protein
MVAERCFAYHRKKRRNEKFNHQRQDLEKKTLAKE